MVRTGRLHALTVYEPILDFANAKVTADNYPGLVFGFIPPSRRKGIEIGVLGNVSDPACLQVIGNEARSQFPIPYEVVKAIRSGSFKPKPQDTVESVLRGCYKLAGRPIELETVVELQRRVIVVLTRHIAEDADPLLGGSDFLVRALRPLTLPKLIRADDGAFDPETNDLHDLWYGYLSYFLAELDERKTRFNIRDGKRTKVLFRDLARCEAAECDQFFFRTDLRRRVCGVRCSDRLTYQRRRQRRRTGG